MTKRQKAEQDAVVRDDLATALVDRVNVDLEHRDALDELFAALVERLDRQSRAREAAKVFGERPSPD